MLASMAQVCSLLLEITTVLLGLAVNLILKKLMEYVTMWLQFRTISYKFGKIKIYFCTESKSLRGNWNDFQLILGGFGLIGLLLKIVGPITIAVMISLIGLNMAVVAEYQASKKWSISLL